MRGARGGRSVLFTDPVGNHFAELAALRSDFTNPLSNGKIPLTKISALQSIDSQDRKVGAVRFIEG